MSGPPRTTAAVASGVSHRQMVKVTGGLLLALLVASLSGTVLTTALPTIVGELGGQDKLSWIMSAAMLTQTASMPLWGKLSDLYGRKWPFQLSVVIFVVASAIAGLSRGMGELVAARALQGIGIGGIVALVQAIMADLVSPRERARYIGYLSISQVSSTMAGPLIGGFLVDAEGLGWRWCFYVCVPIAAAALLVIHRTLDLPRRHSQTKVDYLGAAFITGGASALLLVLSLGGEEFAWRSGWAYGLFASAAALLALAVVQERRAPEPILPPRLFRLRTFRLTSVAAFMVGQARFGIVVFLPLYFQVVKGIPPTASGLLLLPMMAAAMTASIVSGRLIASIGRWKVFPVAGIALAALGLFLLSRVDIGTPLVVSAVCIAVLGLGVGMSQQVLVLAVQNAVPSRDIGIGTTAVTFFSLSGGAVGVALLGAVLSSRLGSEITSRFAERGIPAPSGDVVPLGSPEAIRQLPEPLHEVVIESLMRSLSAVFLVGVPLALIGLVVLLLVRETPLRTTVDSSSPDDAPAP